MKRLFDLVFSIVLLALFFLPIVMISILVILTSRGPILYWSNRVGLNNETFLMPKFRTMKVDTPAVATHLLDNPEQFLSPIGHFLRKYSLDEIPQLFSILKGDMSFVGPRPALFNQNDLISLRTKNKIDQLIPGLTGWAQVNGRDELSIESKLQLDIDYMKNKSFLFDLKIIWLTILRVISTQDISH